MIKYFCDACGEEKRDLNNFSYLCHIGEHNLANAYVDSDGNRTSGREETKHFCNRCYNRILSKAWQEMKEIQKESE